CTRQPAAIKAPASLSGGATSAERSAAGARSRTWTGGVGEIPEHVESSGGSSGAGTDRLIRRSFHTAGDGVGRASAAGPRRRDRALGSNDSAALARRPANRRTIVSRRDKSAARAARGLSNQGARLGPTIPAAWRSRLRSAESVRAPQRGKP